MNRTPSRYHMETVMFKHVARKNLESSSGQSVNLRSSENVIVLEPQKDTVEGNFFKSGFGSDPQVSDGAEPREPANLGGRTFSIQKDQVGVYEQEIHQDAAFMAHYRSAPSAFLNDRDRVLASNKPFIFICYSEENKDSQHQLVFLNCSTYYDQVDANKSFGKSRKVDVFYVKSADKNVRRLGTIEDLEADSKPLAYHLLMLNDDVFCGKHYNSEEYSETVAAAALMFGSGTYVQKDEEQARALSSSIDENERDCAFGSIYLELVRENRIDLAIACLPYGVQLHSGGKNGQTQLFASLHPGREAALDGLLTLKADRHNLPALVQIIEKFNSDNHVDGIKILEETISIVLWHIERLRNL